ncbi:hypothetical protein HZA33_04850 [Candidatus Pacearchaeota archaeon]|nr:hypothetical protein [Candidatus Pacearchaeota archaeon]
MTKDLLEQLEEEETPVEKVTLKEEKNNVRRIANILKSQKPSFNFEDLPGTKIPEMSLAWFLSNGLHIERVNTALKEDSENAFLNLTMPEKRELPMVQTFFPDKSPIYSLFHYARLRERRFDGVGRKEDLVFQYIDHQPLASIAAKKLLRKVPLISSNIDKISNMQDLVDIINCYRIISVAKDERKTKIKELMKEKDKRAEELLTKSLSLLFSETYPTFFNFLSLVEKKKIDTDIASKAINEMFPNMRVYEQAACFYDLFQDKRIRDIFSTDEIYSQLDEDREKLKGEQPDFARMWKNLVKKYFKQFKVRTKTYRPLTKEDLDKNRGEGLELRVSPKSTHFGQLKGREGSVYCECKKDGKNKCKVNWKGGEADCLDIENLEVITHSTKNAVREIPKHIEFPQRLNYNGYENLCTQFILEEILGEGKKIKLKAREGKIKVGDIVGIFGSEGRLKDGSWGYVTEIDDWDGLLYINFQYVEGNDTDKLDFMGVRRINKRHARLIEDAYSKDKEERAEKFKEIKEELENKGDIGKYVAKVELLNALSERLGSIFKN